MLIHDRLIDIHHWLKYSPYEPQYYKFEPHIIASGHKIVDVYQSFSTARTSLSYLDVQDYGELIGEVDEFHLLFIRSIFIQNALIYYNISIDLAWQVLWLFYGPSTYDLMYEDLYLKSTEECKLPLLQERLEYLASFPSSEKKTIIVLLELLNKQFGASQTTKIRKKYNYLKHRGTFHFKGLGMNDARLGIRVNNFAPLMLRKEVLDINEWKEILIEFDNSFVQYFEKIVTSIIPKDYLSPSWDFTDPINYHFKIQNYLNSKNMNKTD